MTKAINDLITLFKWVGAFSIAAMMFLTCADVIMRAFGHPIFGAVEISGFLATTALACALPYTHSMKGHVGVDMLVRRMSDRGQAIVDFITGTLSMVLFGLISWQSFVYAGSMKQSGEVSMTLEFPAYIFIYFIGFAFSVFTLAILLDVIQYIKKVFQK